MRIMFVCHGNICRSPMAEFIFKKLIADRGMADRFEVASSATSSEEIYCGVGNPVYPPAAAMLARRGIFCGGKRARRLTKDDYSKYDLFVGMDSANIRNMHLIFGSDPERKIRKLMDYTKRGGNVDDPWYTGNFETAYADIYEGCAELLKALIE